MFRFDHGKGRRAWPAVFLFGAMLLVVGCGRTSTVGGTGTVSHEQDCANGIDDDVDGLLDCRDPDCGSAAVCFVGQEHCGNGIDDDGDGLVDCEDPDCFGHPACVTPGPERCDNGLDDDGDGLIDCQDPDCFNDPICIKPGQEICTNGRDDDGDGLVDCQDPDCFNHPACFMPGQEICTNGFDDDNDGLVDCQDPDCFNHPACIKPGQENCTNKIDDDNDGLVDCKDPDCLGHPACGPKTEICNNLQDDDGDGKTDCDDSDCQTFPACLTQNENCSNFIDDDNDGLVDCKDPDCFKHPDCKLPGQEVCNNGVDDDFDGLIDCDDPDCKGLPLCQPGKEICDNGKDDDGDGAADCDDPDCKTFPACQTLLCQPAVDFGTLNPTGSKVTKAFDTTGRPDTYTSTCAVPGGGEVVAHFRLSGNSDVKLSYTQITGDHVFALFRAGVAEACNANPAGCFDPESAKTGDFSLKGLLAGDYYLIVEAFAGSLEGKTEVTLSTGTPTTPENCSNGVDDDGDGAIDCADLDCVLTPGCTTQNCVVDVNLGALVINGPSKQVTIDTSTGGDDIDEKCAAGGGGDRVIRFVMPGAGGVDVTVDQGAGWHVFGLHVDKGPGTTCTADAGSCFDSNSTPAFILEYGSVEKGVYYYVVDALNSSSGGVVNLTFRAFQPRGPELCANGIDDDGDGLIDCLDPDCVGVVGCPGPLCVPDFKTGPLAVGSPPVTFQIDTTSANNDQTVPCALGGGKDEVVGIELTAVSGLRVTCQQFGGDQVLGLFAAGAPRDPCDMTPINCADPKTGSLGCDFIFPNLQPGKYYLVVEAFQPGNEGSMQLSLSATPDHAQEICNNGVDDDGDGKIDCQDSNCAAKPICQGQTCTPDQKLGLIVKSGGIKNVAVTTTGAGDGVSAACALGGGEDSVVAFTLAELATVQLDFAQFGNHVFALYEDKGQGFACDAAPLGCQASNNQPTGKVQFSGVKPGQYFLVVEASAAGAEGSVVMQLQSK